MLSFSNRDFEPLPASTLASPISPTDDRLLKIEEAAKICRVDEKVIRNGLFGDCRLRLVTLGEKTLRIRLCELQRWWESRQEDFANGDRSIITRSPAMDHNC